jgi:hypothetical protein
MDAPQVFLDPMTPPPACEQRSAATLAEAFALGRLYELCWWHTQTPSDPDVGERLDAASEEFASLSSRSDLDRRFLLGLGRPCGVFPPVCAGLPSIAWTIPDAVANDSWNSATSAWTSTPDAPPIVPTQPYQIRELTDFPHDTHVLSILDPRHAACATTAEALRSQAQDLERLRAVVPAPDRYAALVRLRAWYATTSSVAYARLAPDHYRDWRPELPLPRRYELIVPEVAYRGATALSHRVLCMRMAAHAFGEQFEQALHTAPAGADLGEHVLSCLVSSLESASRSNGRVLDALNQALADSAGVATEGCVLMQVHRTPQDDHPRLAVIPVQDASAATVLRNSETGPQL